MSKLRPECLNGSTAYCPPKATALLMTLNAIKAVSGLAHGKLHRGGLSCSIGSYFDVNPKLAYPGDLTDEVAAVNDSVPSASPRQRKLMMVRWLKWKLGQCGMAEFKKCAKP